MRNVSLVAFISFSLVLSVFGFFKAVLAAPSCAVGVNCAGINVSGGNVGIGTTGPNVSLQVHAVTNPYIQISSAYTGSDSASGLYLGYATTGTIAEIRQKNNNALAFFTNNAEKMRITELGNVGIGTTTPTYGLTVVGTASFSQPVIVGTPTLATHAATKSYVDSAGGGSGGWTDGGTNVYLTTSTDNVGIGTTGPTSKLTVIGGVKVGTNAYGDLNNGGISIGDIAVDYSPTGGNWTTSGTTLLLSALNYSVIGFHDAGVRVDFIRSGAGTIQLGYNGGWGEASIGFPGSGIWNSSGNVGIGTTGPGYKLDVSGDIRATGIVRANANGAAYFCGGDDACLYDVNATNTVGLYGAQNSAVGTLRLGSGGADISGSGGNVGIGTTGPISLLDVKSNSNNNIGISPISIVTALNAPLGQLQFRNGVSDTQVYAQIGSYTAGTGWGNNGDLRFYTTHSWGAGLPERMRIDKDGNVGIGTTSPGAVLDVAQAGNGIFGIELSRSGGTGDPNRWYLWNMDADAGYGDDFEIWQYPASGGSLQRFSILDNGNVVINNSVTASAFYYASDISLKTDINPLGSTLSKILKLNGVSYKWKDTGKSDIGLIAQDVEKVFPEFVSTEGGTGLKSVDYAKLTVPLIEAVKEQQEEINKLKQEIEQLKADD